MGGPVAYLWLTWPVPWRGAWVHRREKGGCTGMAHLPVAGLELHQRLCAQGLSERLVGGDLRGGVEDGWPSPSTRVDVNTMQIRPKRSYRPDMSPIRQYEQTASNCLRYSNSSSIPSPCLPSPWRWPENWQNLAKPYRKLILRPESYRIDRIVSYRRIAYRQTLRRSISLTFSASPSCQKP